MNEEERWKGNNLFDECSRFNWLGLPEGTAEWITRREINNKR